MTVIHSLGKTTEEAYAMRKGWAPLLDGVEELAGRTVENVRRNADWLIRERGLKRSAIVSLAGLGDRTLDKLLEGAHSPELRVVAALAAVLKVDPWEMLLLPTDLKSKLKKEDRLGPLQLRPGTVALASVKDDSRSASGRSAPGRRAVGQNKGVTRTSPTTRHLAVVR